MWFVVCVPKEEKDKGESIYGGRTSPKLRGTKPKQTIVNTRIGHADLSCQRGSSSISQL